VSFDFSADGDEEVVWINAVPDRVLMQLLRGGSCAGRPTNVPGDHEAQITMIESHEAMVAQIRRVCGDAVELTVHDITKAEGGD
jgi:hypothetical protein